MPQEEKMNKWREASRVQLMLRVWGPSSGDSGEKEFMEYCAFLVSCICSIDGDQCCSLEHGI